MSRADRERAFWDRHASHYDRSMKLLGGPFPRMLELVGDSVAGAGHVLEVAAGTGLVTAAVAPRVGRLVATDYAEAMLDVLRRRVEEAGFANVVCERADLYALAFPPASFDAVVACNVLHLVPDLPAALAALRRVARPDGRLIAPTFCHDQTLRSRLASRALSVFGQPIHRRFTIASLREAVERSGMRVSRSETLPGLIPIGYVEAVGAGAR
ncbi:MAG TPA: methyltransferase domain-containing protein [Thermoanaerobaculia bacterium]|nr:methyltransferase domain-containing protein [Thermoanaerobaculia bacterium]